MAEERVRRRLAAILAADVAGYSRMMGADEEGTLTRLKNLRADVIDPRIADYGGRVFKTTGDGFLAEFPSAVDAVRHAIDVQRAIAEINTDQPEDDRIAFRIGISLGDVMVDGDDLFGNGVNVAARMEGLAEAGGVCISQNVHEHVSHSLDVALDDLGEQAVKNIERPVRCYRIRFRSDGNEETNASAPLWGKPAVAVLPFANMSGDPEQEYFADGLTEDIITALSLWRSFPVIARNSTFAFKNTSPDIRQVGQELGARYIIEGSVRRSATRVRVTVQLINAENGHHVWSERFDRDIADFFDLQEEIAHRVAATVEPELTKAENRRSSGKAPASMDAWECFHRGLLLLEKLSRENHAEARSLFQRAIALDPEFGQAHAGLALSYHRDLYSGFADDPDFWKRECLKSAERAVEIDERDAFAHAILAFALIQHGRTNLAIAECERAIEVNPSSAWGYGVLGFALFRSGRHVEAISTYVKALALNPTDPWNYIRTTFRAECHLHAGQYEEAVDWAQRSIGRASHHLHAHLVLAAGLGFLGRTEEAGAALQECERSHPGFTRSLDEFWAFRKPEDKARLLEGLRKAGWTG